MKKLFVTALCLSLLLPAIGQEKFVYPEQYKTTQDSSFSDDDVIIVEYYFLFDDWGLEIHEWTKSLYDFIITHPDLNFTIVSHTDTRGSDESNMKLSIRRAEGIKNDLLELGIDHAKLTTVGKGESEPIYSDEMIANLTTNEDREKVHAINRRIELHVKIKKTEHNNELW